MTQCKHRIEMDWRQGWRNCFRSAVRDGYCTRHHPTYVSPSQAAAEAEWEREKSDPVYEAEKRLGECQRYHAARLRDLAEAKDEVERAWADVVEQQGRLAALKPTPQPMTTTPPRYRARNGGRHG